MLWIGLHLPSLSLESFAATLSEVQARPIALLEEQRIVQADARALALGVRPGIQRATALALAPDLVLGQADAQRDAQALQAVAHAALAFTPAVTIDDTPAVHTALLEVQASLRCFGGAPRLLQLLRAATRPLGHRLQMASAPTALGAALLARWRDDRALGPHSTDRAALRALLDAAPVWLLGPGRAHWEALQGMGLRVLADLRHLPRAGLARRFGAQLLLDLDRARGDAPDPRTWVELPPRFDSRLELFTRADTTDELLAGARVLLARLLAWAAAQQARIGRFTLVMHHERRHRGDEHVPPASTLDIALAQASCDIAHLHTLLAERLARAPLPAPVLHLSLRCDAPVFAAPPNAELFPTRASEREGLVRLIERLQARLGRDQVQRLALRADHRPEQAVQLASVDAAVAVVAPAGGVAGAPSLPAHFERGLTLARPVWLLPSPRPLPERAARPLLDGQPLQLVAGPERIEAGWWDGALAARDYFIALAGDGALVWVFRERLPKDARDGWFLHGRFA